MFISEKNFIESWTGRIDSEDDRSSFRFHQVVQVIDRTELPQAENYFSFVGFECDEGVRRNKGRQGARYAPNALREFIAKLPYHLQKYTFDIGNVTCVGQELESAQERLGEVVQRVLSNQGVPIILGGGHETLYGHYLGARKHVGREPSIGIINIDAHFDMRSEERPSSGTMFKQILENDEHAGYLCIGIQQFGNTESLFKTAESLGSEYIFAEDVDKDNFKNTFETIDAFSNKHDYLIMTLCSDVLDAAAAPGVSAPSPLGLDPKVVKRILTYVAKDPKLLSFDISEVNPIIDEQDKTVRLGANLVAEVMYAIDQK